VTQPGLLVQTQWVQAGDVVAVTNDPLGEVAADFTARPS
jgi:predicted deacylase